MEVMKPLNYGGVYLLGKYVITHTYDEIEGPVFWFSDENWTIKRWPEYVPNPDWLQCA